VTVVLCTRDRPALLRTALESVLAMDYPDFDVIVVDNASSTDATRNYVLGLAEPRVRVIDQPRPGLARARNTGLLAATSDIVAFTDDDVVVDRHWLRALLDGFARGVSVSCVSGIVPAGELRTPAQAYFDRRVGWSRSTDARVFDWARPPRDVPLFPFAVRCYGVGANFAVKRDVVRRLGGFDEFLGPGTSTGGGDDIDMFFRILRSGRQLVREPAAVVWHRHRPENEALLEQTRGYGLGLGAWLAKIARDPEIVRLAVKTAAVRAPACVRHIRAASIESAPSASLATLLPPRIGDETWRFMLKGAWAYRSALHDERLPEPLLDLMARQLCAASTELIDES
jgi:glycosyltransferase involved in cell wall biosynthesis